MSQTPKKKIAFFMYDMRVGGVETVLVNTINALLKQSVDITLYSHRTILEPVHVQWLQEHPEIHVEIYYPYARFFDKIDKKHPITHFIKRICFEIYKSYRNTLMGSRVRRQGFDALIDYISGYSAKPLKKIHAIPKLTWIHCSFDYFYKHNLIHGLEQYDKIITISDSCLQDFSQTYPQYANRAIRIYNPINIQYIQEKLKSATIPNGKYFTCVSRLDTDKDIPTLLYAFDKFWQNAKKPNVQLYIVGDGSKKHDFTKLANSLPSSSNIIFTGKQTNPFGYMTGAMAHVLSSYNEGFGQVLVESIVANTLNISSDCKSGPREILLNGRAGILFEPGNIDELAHAFDEIYNNRTKTEQMKGTATKSLTRFDSDNIATQIIDLISGIKK